MGHMSEFFKRTNIELSLEECRKAIYILSGDAFKAWMYLRVENYQNFFDKTALQIMLKQIPIQDPKAVKTELINKDYLIYRPNIQLYYFIANPPDSLSFGTIDSLIKGDYLSNYQLRQSTTQMLNFPGIYGFGIDNKFLYIGKSVNIGERVNQHLQEIREGNESNKYKILREAKLKGYSITLYVLYQVSFNEGLSVAEVIGQKEGEYIRAYLPPLNYQIPKEEDWNSYTTNERAKIITLKEVLEETKPFIDFKPGWFPVSL